MCARVIGFILFGISTAPSWAQEPKNRIGPDTGTRKPYLLREAVVQSKALQTATRLPRTESTELLSARDFAALASPNTADQFGRVAGLRMQQTCSVCGAAEVQLNGLEGPYTSILIDSTPLVGSLASIYATQGIPALLLRGIEITRGQPGAALPAEALGGTLNLLTRPAGEVVPQMRLLGGSFAEATADVAAPINTRWALYGQLGTRQLPPDKNKDGYLDLVRYNRASLAAVGQVAAGRWATGTVYIRSYSERRTGGETAYDRRQDRLAATRYGEDIALYRGEALSRWQWQSLRPGLRAHTQVSASWHHQAAAYGTNKYLGIQTDASMQHGWQLTLGPAVLEAGPSLRFLHYSDNTPTRRIEITPGLYAQAQLPINSFWVQTGLRLDATAAHGVQASPRVHMRYQPGAGITLRASTGRGYRVVNVITEDHAALTGTRRVVVPARLQPELAYTSLAEIAYDTTLGTLRLGLAATGWYNYFQHKILPDYDTDPDAIIYRNTPEQAVNQGIALQATASQGAWGLRASGTALRYVRQPAGQAASPVVYAPRWQAQAEATYRGPQWGATLRALSTGPMALPLQPSDTRPARSKPYALLSAQVSYTISHHATVLAQANNLGNWQPQYAPLWRPQDPFDKTATEATGTFDTAYVYGPLGGRSFVVGIDITL